MVRTGGAQSRNDGKARGARRPGPAGTRPAPTRSSASATVAAEAGKGPQSAFAETATGPRLGWREAIEKTVAGLHYELVDVERAPRGLLRVTLDRVPGHAYATGASEFVLVEDCELVTRQLQYALEVEGLDYARLEVSSPGLDRPLKREADYERFAGQEVAVTLKAPFNGRKAFKGVLGRGADGAGWQLVFSEGKIEQVLGFGFDEVRDARLVPVLDFKGRRKPAADDATPVDGG